MWVHTAILIRTMFILLFFFLHHVADCTVPVITEHDMNNIPNYIHYPGTSVGSVVYLGNFTDHHDSDVSCSNACSAYTDHAGGGEQCLTFTHYLANFSDSAFAGLCYGGIDDPRWAPMSMKNVNSGRLLYPCTTGMDCSLNGKCIDGKCACRKAWTGWRCDELVLLPAQRKSGYHYMTDGRNISSWGGAVLRGDDGKYHMYASEMANHCGIHSFSLNSQLTHAVSDDPLGTYERHDVVRPPFAHEPDAIKGPKGEYVLFWSDYKYDMPLCNCTDGSTVPGCKYPDPWVKVNGTEFWTYMSYSMDPNGPWSDPVAVVTKEPFWHDNNLAPVILKNGSMIGFWRLRGDKQWYLGSRIHLITAIDWKDPTTYNPYPQEVWPDIPSYGIEDPFVYLDEDGFFHAIFHNSYPNTDKSCGGHGYSQDGIHWKYGGQAYGSKVTFTDGSSVVFGRRERPHFIFAADGFTPIGLTNGVKYGGKYGDATYTLLQPVQH